MRRHLAAVALVAASLLVACGSGGNDDAYTAVDLASGEPVGVADLTGEPALLVSWATWCRECDEELAGLQEFASSDAAEGLQIVAVDLDAGDVEDEIWEKVERHDLSVELWRDPDNGFRSAFGALGVPTSVVLDAEGEVVGTFPGAVDFDDEEVLAALEQATAS